MELAVAGDQIVIAVGAIVAATIAAVITAVTAQQRLHKTLDVELDRLKEELEHDRVMRDRDELRVTIDQAVTALGRAIDLTLFAHTRIGFLSGSASGEEVDQSLAALGEAREQSLKLRGIHDRLALRLGHEYPIAQMYWSTAQALGSALRDLGSGAEPLTAEESAAVDQWIEASAQRNRAFLDLARTYVGSLAAVDPVAGPE
jgi:hypothetical protein